MFSCKVVPSRNPALIDFTEAVYDLESPHDDWVRTILEAGAPALDNGLGVFALTAVRPPERAPLRIEHVHEIGGRNDLTARLRALEARVDMSSLWPLARSGIPKTLSEVTHDHNSALFSPIMGQFDFAKDAIGMSALDSSGRGVYMIIPLPKVTSLSKSARERWEMLAAHLRAGYRLRRAVAAQRQKQKAPSALPFYAEAVIDATDFRVTEAASKATSRPALAALRNAARESDRARGRMRDTDPQRALELWRALVRGRWSMVDWFDSGGRRYVLGIPNPPDVLDPRGLTERELQVVSFAVLGMTNKMIAYNLGLSAGRVSTLLSLAMKKLAVRTRAELVKRAKEFEALTPR